MIIKCIKYSILLILLLGLFAGFDIFPSFAQEGEDWTPITMSQSILPEMEGADFAVDPSKVQIQDQGGEKATKSADQSSQWSWLEDWAKKAKQLAKDAANATAFKKTLRAYFQRLAYETAVYVATGDKGQAPMFQTDNVADFLTNQVDNVAGFYIESLGSAMGKEFGVGELNLCEPSLQFKIKLVGGLIDDYGPQKPDCTFTKMKENWEEEIGRKDFLDRFSTYFGMQGNDLSTSLAVHSDLMEKTQKAERDAILETLKNAGIKDVTDPVTGKIKTPGSIVGNMISEGYNSSKNSEEVFTGNAAADYIAIFTDTLIGKLLDKWLKEGLVDDAPDNSYDWERLTSEFADSRQGGVSQAEDRYYEIVQPDFTANEPYDALVQLSSCPDPNNPGPTECVLWKDNGDESSFYQAIIGAGNDGQYYTVAKAMAAGMLHRDGLFGFIAKDVEPRQPDNIGSYSYRNMKILRKYRIIPVGWELAAEYINQEMASIGPKTLGDLVACYDPNDDYEGYNAGWCQGLVDPNWVLRAPANFCKRKGPGPVLTESATSEKYVVNRDEEYCGDEQACIKENADGQCEAYGYCTEERGTWDFGGKSCEPIYNTCSAFSSDSTDSQGKKAAYLENTLDFTACSPDNPGCRAYCTVYNFAGKVFDCTPTSGSKIFADNALNEAADCGADSEGCHEFVRTAAGKGANLIINSSFEDYTGTPDDAAADTFENFSYTQGQALTAAGGAAVYNGLTILQMAGDFSQSVAIGPADGFYQTDNEILVFSAHAYACAPGDYLEIRANGAGGGLSATSSLNTTPVWVRNSVSLAVPENATGNAVTVSIYSNTCRIDAIMLEKGAQPSSYRDYRDSGLVYQKLAPDYLSCDGDPDEPECADYVRYCSFDELGCELYTSQDDFSVPARVGFADYCPEECVGYDEYLQTDTYFDSLQAAYIIPERGKTCSAQAAGCDEFTNLDKLGSGAEAREYYSRLRACRKPDGACREFYTWEGSDQSGYQLKVYSLEAGLSGEPQVVDPSLDDCSKEIYELPASHPDYDPDCREFYDKSGNISYHLYSLTVECSSDCHPYRRTEKNIIPQSDCAAACGTDPACAANCSSAACADAASNGSLSCAWDAGNSVFCKNGGTWNSQQQSCIYLAIPGQGQKCSAAQAGCREYSGQTGSNIRTVLNSDFESSYISDWSGDFSWSASSLKAGGHSLEITGTGPASTTLGRLLNKNKSYTLKFLARANTASEINVLGIGTSSAGAYFVPFSGLPLSLSPDWELYELSLEQLNNAADTFRVDSDTALFVGGNGSFLIDSVRLTEISDRYYLLKSSLTVPEACDYDILGNFRGWAFNLGCEAYTDREGETSNLHSFSSLCSDSAIGCEVMIDTHNYSDYRPGIWNDSNADNACTAADGQDCITVPADEYRYVVFDNSKLCMEAEKGCQLLGEQHIYAGSAYYTKKYLANDPDAYDQTLCGEEAEGCSSYNGGTAYFKDPGDMACEWRQRKDAGGALSTWGWFKKPAKFCDSDGDGVATSTIDSPCQADEHCPSGQSCLLDSRDYACDASGGGVYPTFGYGGTLVSQPVPDGAGYAWAGLCPVAGDTCTEYIDPLSLYSANLVSNSGFDIDVDSDSVADYWETGIQEFALSQNTLYVLSVENTGGTVNSVNLTSVGGAPVFMVLDEDNRLNAPVASLSLAGAAGLRQSLRFYIGESALGASVRIAPSSTALGNGSRLSLAKAVVKYELASQAGEGSCNSRVSYDDGCVLFNKRSVESSSGGAIVYSNLLFNADRNELSASREKISDPGANNAGEIVKVLPNRTCAEWLACRSLVKEDDRDICLDVGLCNNLDRNYNCDSFVVESQINQSLGVNYGSEYFANKTGYVVAGIGGGDYGYDYYPVGKMDETGSVGSVSNGGFEIYGSNFYPLGWNGDDRTWEANHFKVINTPLAAAAEAVSYAPVGKSFLKLGANYTAVSEFVEVSPGNEYIVSAYVNTLNLINASSSIRVQKYDNAGAPIDPPFDVAGVSLQSGRDWTSVLGYFQATGANVARVKLFLHTNAFPGSTAEGNVYFDDVRIRPGLNMQDGEYIKQTCRLYPESDSLACSYLDEQSGLGQKGLLGYCLQHDSAPGNPDNCVLWHPIDQVKGDGRDDGIGYNDRFPLYYTVENEYVNLTITENHNLTCEHETGPCSSFNIGHVAFQESNRIYSTDLVLANEYGFDLTKFLNVHYLDRVTIYHNDRTIVLTPADAQAYGGQTIWFDSLCCWNSGSCWKGVVMWDEDGNLDWTALGTVDNSSHTSCHTGEHIGARWTFYFRVPFASEIVQVVSPVGQNKYWSARAHEGSNYAFSCNDSFPSDISICSYATDYQPFGSLVSPAETWSELVNPYEWDSDSNIVNNQPLFYAAPDTSLDPPYQPRMGQLHTVDAVKRLFAESYGVWEWNGSNYVLSDTGNWGPPGTNGEPDNGLCDGTGLPGTRQLMGDTNFAISQPDGTFEILPATFVTAQSASEFYNYSFSSFNNPAFIDFMGANRSVIFVHTDQDTGQLSLGIFHDWPNDLPDYPDLDSDGGYANFTFVDITPGNNVAVADDPASTPDTINGSLAGSVSSLSNGSVWTWNWSPCCTDGGMVEMPLSSWSTTIEADFPSGITEWMVVYDDGGTPGFITLDRALPLTISHGFSDADYCAITPIISNIRVNNQSAGDLVLANSSEIVNLTFNTQVDSQQLPLTMYSIDWGDGETSIVTNVQMRDRPNPDDPHSLYHLYSFWDLRAQEAAGTPGIDCSDPNECRVRPRIIIKDNWGWCNNAVNYADCDNWQYYPGEIVVQR